MPSAWKSWWYRVRLKGDLEPLKPEDVGYSTRNSGPRRDEGRDVEGVTYDILTNNDDGVLSGNADIFKRAGLDPEQGSGNLDDVVKYSKQIHDKLGIAGYGLVARRNAGKTPYRFMPQLWADGGGVFDEATGEPDRQRGRLGSTQNKAALQASYDMYVRDKVGSGFGTHQPASR